MTAETANRIAGSEKVEPTMRKDIATAIRIIVCLAALGGLAALRFQRVNIVDLTKPQTKSYWRVLLPGQEHKVQLPALGRYDTAEYNIRGLYGLVKVDRQSVTRVWTNASRSEFRALPLSDPSIEAAERINLLQKQRRVWSPNGAP